MSNPMQARLAAMAAKAATSGDDLTKAQAGGGAILTPAGACRARISEYIELGNHPKVWAGKSTPKPYGRIVFELSGPKHQPQTLDDGRVIPFRVRVDEVMGNNEKNTWGKLYRQLAKDYPDAQNFIGLLALGAGWRATVTHPIGKKSGKPYAALKDKDTGWSFASLSYDDPETGEAKVLPVNPLVGTPKIFVWNDPTLEDWDSLFIDGKYDDGGTKNWVQEKIKRALNWLGSPMYVMLQEAGRGAECEPDPSWSEFGKAGQAAGEGAGDGAGEDDGAPEGKAPASVAKPPASALDSADDSTDPLAALG